MRQIIVDESCTVLDANPRLLTLLIVAMLSIHIFMLSFLFHCCRWGTEAALERSLFSMTEFVLCSNVNRNFLIAAGGSFQVSLQISSLRPSFEPEIRIDKYG